MQYALASISEKSIQPVWSILCKLILACAPETGLDSLLQIIHFFIILQSNDCIILSYQCRWGYLTLVVVTFDYETILMLWGSLLPGVIWSYLGLPGPGSDSDKC